MFGSISNFENKFFINEEQILGIESVEMSYSNSPTISKPLGSKIGLTTINGTTQQKISITRNLIYDDPLFSYIYEQKNINGGIEYGGKSYEFNSGYVDEYMVSCAIGSIPKVTTNITVFDEMKTGQVFEPLDLKPEILIPNQGSISVTCDNSTTNRVVGFDYAIKSYNKPIHTIGSLLPSEIVSFPVLEYAASIQIDVDDAFLKNGLSFFENREQKSIIFEIKGRNNKIVQTLSIPNASLVGESLSSSADGGVKLTLNYIGYGYRGGLNLILSVDAGNQESYGGSGNIWKDLIGSINGTLINNPIFNSENGGSFIFDGTNSYVEHTTNLTTINNITNTSSFTFSSIFKLNSFPIVQAGTLTGLLMKGSYNPSYGINLIYDGDSGGFRTRARIAYGIRNINGTAGVTEGYGLLGPTSNASIELGKWYKVDMVHEFSGKTHTLRLYINGVLDRQDTSTNDLYPINFQNTESLGINHRVLSGNFIRSNINIASYSIHNRALSPLEILRSYYAIKERFGLS